MSVSEARGLLQYTQSTKGLVAGDPLVPRQTRTSTTVTSVPSSEASTSKSSRPGQRFSSQATMSQLDRMMHPELEVFHEVTEHPASSTRPSQVVPSPTELNGSDQDLQDVLKSFNISSVEELAARLQQQSAVSEMSSLPEEQVPLPQEQQQFVRLSAACSNLRPSSPLPSAPAAADKKPGVTFSSSSQRPSSPIPGQQRYVPRSNPLYPGTASYTSAAAGIGSRGIPSRVPAAAAAAAATAGSMPSASPLMDYHMPVEDLQQSCHDRQLTSVMHKVYAAPAEEQQALAVQLLQQRVFPLSPSLAYVDAYPADILNIWQALFEEVMDCRLDYNLPIAQQVSEAELMIFKQLLTASNTQQSLKSLRGDHSHYRMKQPVPSVTDWICELNKSRNVGIVVDGSHSEPGTQMSDLMDLLEHKYRESPFSLEDLSIEDQKAVWDTRTLFFGRHLREGPLRAFTATYDSSDLVKFRGAPTDGGRGADWGYKKVVQEVEKMVYQGKGRAKYYKDRLRGLVQRGTVAEYNKKFMDCALCVPLTMVSQEQRWDQWVGGLKDDVQAEVKKQYCVQESKGEYCMDDAMIYADSCDKDFRKRVYQGNAYEALRLGGPTEGTPFAAGGGRGRGRGGYGGGRGAQGRGGFGGGFGGGFEGGFGGGFGGRHGGFGGVFGGNDGGFVRGFDNGPGVHAQEQGFAGHGAAGGGASSSCRARC